MRCNFLIIRPFLTGRDTTAQNILWTVYELLRHPNALQRMRDEVTSALLGATEEAYFEHLNSANTSAKSLPFTHAVVLESLRLHPPIPVEIRQVQQDFMLPDNTFLPSQTLVVWSPYAFGRSPHLYGSDSLHFKPEGWLNDEGQLVPKRPSHE